MLMLMARATVEAERSTRYAKPDQFAKLVTAAKNSSLAGVDSQSASTTRSRVHLNAVKPSPSPNPPYGACPTPSRIHKHPRATRNESRRHAAIGAKMIVKILRLGSAHGCPSPTHSPPYGPSAATDCYSSPSPSPRSPASNSPAPHSPHSSPQKNSCSSPPSHSC